MMSLLGRRGVRFAVVGLAVSMAAVPMGAGIAS
jgi:hypothetical protein